VIVIHDLGRDTNIFLNLFFNTFLIQKKLKKVVFIVPTTEEIKERCVYN